MTDTTTLTPRTMDVRSTFSHVDWSAILAGAAISFAIIAVMTAFGSALGLSLVSPFNSASKWVVAVVVTLWVLWITVSSFAAGGYVCGRMRSTLEDGTAHEGHIRDGAHGLVVWAVALAFGLWWSANVLPGSGSSSSSDRSSSAIVSLKDTATADPFGYAADYLLRSDREPAANAANREGLRREVSRLLVTGVTNGSFSADDKSYLQRLVTARSGISPADADTRINVALGQAKDSANSARKTGILLAFLTAASLVLGAAAAWWGAGIGGRHRDERFDASHLTQW